MKDKLINIFGEFVNSLADELKKEFNSKPETNDTNDYLKCENDRLKKCNDNQYNLIKELEAELLKVRDSIGDASQAGTFGATDSDREPWPTNMSNDIPSVSIVRAPNELLSSWKIDVAEESDRCEFCGSDCPTAYPKAWKLLYNDMWSYSMDNVDHRTDLSILENELKVANIVSNKLICCNQDSYCRNEATCYYPANENNPKGNYCCDKCCDHDFAFLDLVEPCTPIKK